MYVTSVSLSNLSFDEAMGRVTGSVSLEIGNDDAESPAVNAQFLCRIPAGSAMPHSDQVIGLVREALRQARRLPDFVGLCETDAFLPANIAVAT